MYTSPSPLPRRGPLRLPFSVHIRKLFFLFLSLFSGAPRWTHPVGAGVPDGPHRFSFMLPAGLFRAPMDAPRRGRRPRRPASFFFHASGGAIPHPDGRTRRGRRPRRPASFLFHASGGAIPRSGATSFCPRRPANFSLFASGGHISFNSERNMEKNAAKNRWFLDFLPSDCSRPTKRPTSNRPCSHPRCRSHVPRGGARKSRQLSLNWHRCRSRVPR